MDLHYEIIGAVVFVALVIFYGFITFATARRNRQKINEMERDFEERIYNIEVEVGLREPSLFPRI